MCFFVFLLAFVTVAYSQSSRLACGKSCSRRTVVTANIDGSTGTATCSERTSSARCLGCCQARAFLEGLPVTAAAGFISNDQSNCVCCINNTNRNCGSRGTFFTLQE